MGINHVVVGTGTSGTRFLNNKYPVVEGLTAGTTKLPLIDQLIPEKSFLSENQKVGV
jgi:hypothetical protein